MHPSLKKIDKQPDVTFQLLMVDEPYFYPVWHFHPELEIIFIEEGKGTFFFADSQEAFQDGELLFIGPNIPHLFKSQTENPEKNKVRAIVLYFKEESLSEGLNSFPELVHLKDIIRKAQSILKFKEGQSEKIRHVLKEIPRHASFFQLLSFFNLLHEISQSDSYSLLLPEGIPLRLSKNDHRLKLVYDYIRDHLTQEIRLEKVAEIASMNPNAFCRYFRQRTNITLSRFIIQLRIDLARKLLMENDDPIKQICYDTGFNSIPNFISQFKKITQMTPQEYRTLKKGRESVLQENP